MEISITQDLEPLPLRSSRTKTERPEGLLTSNYKSVVNCNYRYSQTNSIFGIKQHVKSSQYLLSPGIETVIKVSVFIITLAFFI